MRLQSKLNLIWSALLLMFIISSNTAQAQFNWPEDKKTAQEKFTLYTDAQKQKNLKAAIEPLQWLLDNAPDLNARIYIDGADIYEGLATKATDGATKKEYTNKALDMYDKRIKYFGDEAEVMNRKASAAIKLLFKDKDAYTRLDSIFSKALAASKDKFAYYDIVPYMSVAKTLHEQGEMDDEQVIELYDKLNEVIDKNEGGKSASKYKEQGEKLDGIFMATVNVDCDFHQAASGT